MLRFVLRAVLAIVLATGSQAASFSSGGGLTAAQSQVLSLLTVNGSNLELDSGYSFKIDSTGKLFASIIQANASGSLDLREDNGASSFTIGTDGNSTIPAANRLNASIIRANAGTSLDLREDNGSSAITIDTSGNATFAQNIIGTHGKGFLAGATGDGFIFNVSGSDGSFLFAVNGSAVSNYTIFPSGTIRVNDVRSGSYYDGTGAGPAIFYAGAVFFPIALPGSPATGLAVSDSGDSNILKHYDGSTWNATY